MNTKIQNATIAALKNKASIKFIDCDKNTETLQNLENNYHIIILFWFRNKLFQRDFSCFFVFNQPGYLSFGQFKNT